MIEIENSSWKVLISPIQKSMIPRAIMQDDITCYSSGDKEISKVNKYFRKQDFFMWPEYPVS